MCPNIAQYEIPNTTLCGIRHHLKTAIDFMFQVDTCNMSAQKRKKWDKPSMLAAVSAVRNKEMGYQKASKQFNVPKSTLRDYIKNADKNPEELVDTNMGRKTTLSHEMETELVNYCLEMERRFYGLNSSDIRRIAFQLALRNNIHHPFSLQKAAAGKKWLRKFLTRHPNLKFRKPQGMSSARVKGFTQENVAKFFDILEPALEKIKSNPARIYNVDETGITTVQSKHSKIISLKGKRQVGAITAAERGALVTMVTCMNAAGGFVPPMLVYPRKNMKQELLDGAPPGTIAGCHPSGWIQQHLFTQWLDHFIKHTKPSSDDPVILILDGHYSHTRNLDLIDLARKHYVMIISLPPHSTHKMQPLDLSFMSPFKTYYSQEIETWLKNHVGRNVTVYQIGELLGKAYLKAATAEVSAHGFRKSGIYPCNRYIFHDYDFAINRQRETTPPPESNVNIHHEEVTPPQKTHIGPEDITPLPSFNETKKTNLNRKGSAKLITSTPYKEELERSVAEIKKRKGIKKKVCLENESLPGSSKMKNGAKKNKRRQEDESNPEKLKTLPGSSKRNNAPKINRRRKAEESDSESSESDINFELDDDSDMNCSSENNDDGDVECMFCLELFSKDREGEEWIRCCKCYKWGHEKCANSFKTKMFICDFCLAG